MYARTHLLTVQTRPMHLGFRSDRLATHQLLRSQEVHGVSKLLVVGSG